VKPFRDEKVIASWNGLMLSAYADAYRATGDAAYRAVAEDTVRFVADTLWSEDGLKHGCKDGDARVPAFLDDYAALAVALLDVYEATFDPRHFDFAERLGKRMIDEFWDDADGGFFFTGAAHEELITRTKPAYDGSVPAGNSIACELLLRLHALTEEPSYLPKAERVLRRHRQALEENAFAHANLLASLDFHAREPREIVVVAPGGAEGARELLQPLGRHYQPNQVVVCYDPAAPPQHLPPFAVDKPLVGDAATAYVCHRRTCSPPVTRWEELRERLGEKP
jgi:uncharacterized protein YyaL (SSP411 family)